MNSATEKSGDVAAAAHCHAACTESEERDGGGLRHGVDGELASGNGERGTIIVEREGDEVACAKAGQLKLADGLMDAIISIKADVRVVRGTRLRPIH